MRKPWFVRDRGRRRALAAVAAGAALCAFATYDATRPHYRTPTDAGALSPVAAPTTVSPFAPFAAPAATAMSATTPRPNRRVDVLAFSPPTRVVIPALGVDARVVAVSADERGALGVPDDPQVLGWWSAGQWPGATSGNVVIDGHVDSARAGEGALFHLDELPMGSRVTVIAGHRTFHYVTIARRVYRKSGLAPSTFSATGAPRLALVTCGGPFNSHTGHYLDNVVVFARPA